MPKSLLKFAICRWLFRRHKWGYVLGGGKGCVFNNNPCECGCSIPVYELTCRRCGLSVTLGVDEVIDCFARRMD
jgi:hypothetical protein